MSEQAKPVGASDKMKAKDFITLGIFTVLFFAVVMVCIFASAATVVTFAFGSAIAAIPGGIIYMLMRAKVPKAGSVLLSGVVIGLIEFLIGAGWAVAVGFIAGAVIAELLARGEGWEYLSPAVYGYILRHGLYGAGRDLKRLPDRELRACSYSMIRAKRIAHVKGTEEEAVRLARRWGADEEHARRAAILHDCTKYLELDEQLQLCAKYGIVLDELEQQAVKLLHSKTGACVARHVYGVSDDIYEAIFWHTTGKADMTLLEKLLYIADYMEPTRDFPGVERLRALAYEDLDAAVLLGCEMSIQEMAERGLPVHPNTVKARDWLRSKTKGTSD